MHWCFSGDSVVIRDMNAVKIVNLRVSPQQAQVVAAIRQGHTMPKDIARAMNISTTRADVILRCIARRNKITRDELRAMAQFVTPVPFTRRRKPTVYREDGRWVARYYGARRKFLGLYDTESEALAAWTAYHTGKPVPKSPYARGTKPMVYLRKNRWRAFLWHPERRKTIFVGAFDTKSQAVDAWREAKIDGVYTKWGWIKV